MRNLTMNEVEDIIYNMLRLGLSKKYIDSNAPKVIVDNEKARIDKIVNRYPNIDKVYEEYLEYADKCGAYIKKLELKEPIHIECEQGDYDVENYVYQITSKECDKNIAYGMLFDTESLAIAWMYKKLRYPHPLFDELIKHEMSMTHVMELLFGEA